VKKLAAAALATASLVVLLVAPPAFGAPVLMQPSALPPQHGAAGVAGSGYIPLHAREFALAKARANARAQTSARPSKPRGGGPTVSSYANVSPSFNGTYQSGVTPPDATGAIGPDRYVEAVNTQFAIYTRAGAAIGSGSLSDLTGIPTGLFGYGLSDPQVMWDAKTQRFYYATVYYDSLFFSENGIAVGWSTTARPGSAADFCKYVISFGSELPDYPKLGDSADFLLFGYNLFGFFASTYDGSEFAMVNKPPAGTACPPASAFAVHVSGTLHNADGSLAATPVPANLVDDDTGSGYVVANADLSVTPSADFVSVYSVGTAGTDASGLPVPAVGGPTNVAVPAYAMPADAPQLGSAYLLDTLDGRFEAAVAAVDPARGNAPALWTAHAVFGGAGAVERWYELDPSAGTVLQSNTVGDASLFAWNGAVSPDRAHDGTVGAFGASMAMSVSTSSSTTYPAIRFVSQRGAGVQSPLLPLVQSGGAAVDLSCSSSEPCRWGDYSGASPDPVAAGGVGRVWLANQYTLAGGSTSSTAWRSWVFAVAPGP